LHVGRFAGDLAEHVADRRHPLQVQELGAPGAGDGEPVRDELRGERDDGDLERDDRGHGDDDDAGDPRLAEPLGDAFELRDRAAERSAGLLDGAREGSHSFASRAGLLRELAELAAEVHVVGLRGAERSLVRRDLVFQLAKRVDVDRRSALQIAHGGVKARERLDVLRDLAFQLLERGRAVVARFDDARRVELDREGGFRVSH
jgi:hypothetical protein